MLNKEKNVSYKALERLFGSETAETLFGISEYIKKHNIKDYDKTQGVLVLDRELLTATQEELTANTIKKPRELSEATKQARYEKKLAELKAKYNIKDGE